MTADSGTDVVYFNLAVELFKPLFNEVGNGTSICIAGRIADIAFAAIIKPSVGTFCHAIYNFIYYTTLSSDFYTWDQVILLGEPDAFLYSVHHEEERRRKTDLCEKLKQFLNKKNQNGKDITV